MNIDGEIEKEKIMRELKAELEGINTYGKTNVGEHYQPLSEHHISKALSKLEDLLEEVKQESLEREELIHSSALRFRYDGGSKPKEDVLAEEKAQTTAIVLDWKKNHGMKLQIKPLPYHEFESKGPGLRVSGYGIMKFLKR